MASWTLQQLLSQTPEEFAGIVMRLWAFLGYEIVSGPHTEGDRGISLLARTRTHNHLTVFILAKLRHPENMIGVQTITECAMSRQRSGVDAVAVVTTSGFTREASEAAEEHNVKLIDGDELVRLLYESRIPAPRSVRASSPRVSRSANSGRANPSSGETGKPETQGAKEGPKLGSMGWGVTLVLFGIAGVTSVIIGANPWPLVFLFVLGGLAGAGLLLNYHEKWTYAREIHVHLGLSDAVSRRLAVIGVPGVWGVAKLSPEQLAAWLDCEPSESIRLICRAKSICGQGESDSSAGT